MAEKKVYFFKVTLLDKTGREVDYRDIKGIFQEIIEKNGVLHKTYRSLDLTVEDEYTHIIWDVFDYQNERLFGRLSKQQPSNSFLTRDYSTLEKEDVNIPDETRAGIEKYTYGVLDYPTGIFSIVSALGAPTEKVIANALWKYNTNYMVQIVPIPNADAISLIYTGEDSVVTRVEVEVPLPEAGFLEDVLGWKEKDILDSLEQRNLKMGLYIKSPEKRGRIARDSDETKKILDCILGQMRKYSKARVKAKTRKVKMREYDLFEDNFSNPIDISSYHIVGRKRVYYTVDQLVDLYRHKIVESFEENKKLLTAVIKR